SRSIVRQQPPPVFELTAMTHSWWRMANAASLPGLLCDNSFAFLNRHQAVGRDAVDKLLRAAEPSHLDSLRTGSLAQTEMQAKVALRAEAAAAADFLDLAAAAPVDDHARADG